MLVAVTHLLTFGFTGKSLRAGQLLRMQTTTTFLFGNNQTLENGDVLVKRLTNQCAFLLTCPHLSLWQRSMHICRPQSSNFWQVLPHAPISSEHGALVVSLPQGQDRGKPNGQSPHSPE